jgi:endonuclease/exonuclease/phosphatase family metal-dependent hydrolase
MPDQKISALLALSLLSTPISLSAATPSYNHIKEASSSAGISSTSSSQRASLRRMKDQLAVQPILQPMGTYVGELQEKWQFPSDHLPIGMTFENLHFASWNVLDAEYMSWVTEKNSQGLSRSLIVDEHVYIGDSKLTVRDRHVVDLILETLSHPTHPRSILSLQECSKPFLEELRSRLPSHFEMISNHGDAVLLDKRSFELVEAKEVSGIFSDTPYRTLQDIKIRRLNDGEMMRLVNVHLPGDPTKPGRFEFAEYLNLTFDPALTTLAMGDMNFDELGMSDAMSKAFQNNSPFSLNSPYPTDISPYVFKSKAIDHFLVYSPKGSAVTLNAPDQIMSELAPLVALLKGEKSQTTFLQKNQSDEIADFAQKNCLNEGTLQKTRDYVYVKLNDEYLTQVFNKIKETNTHIRMASFRGGIGPHFSIIRHDEWKGTPPNEIAEIGNRYLFTPVRVDLIQTAHKRLWVLIVEPSDELAAFRNQYAVGDIPHGHEFHITLAQDAL